jgi:prevent-host-death family protein
MTAGELGGRLLGSSGASGPPARGIQPKRRGTPQVTPSIGIRELAASVSAVVAAVARSGRPAVVTKHGSPVAAVIPIADLHELLLARAARAGDAAGAAGAAGGEQTLPDSRPKRVGRPLAAESGESAAI